MQLKNHRYLLSLLACSVSIGLFSQSAYAFSDDEARKAIIELRAQVRQMNEQNQQAKLMLADQVDQLNQEIAILRGRLEELSHRSLPSVEESKAPKVAGNLDPQEKAIYEGAANLYRNGRYKEAATGFSDFVDSFPNSSMANDARFYLGSSMYASKEFKNSINVLQNLVDANPRGNKSPDALLVIAANNIELNNISAAKTSLERIISEYPNSSAAETAKNRLKLL